MEGVGGKLHIMKWFIGLFVVVILAGAFFIWGKCGGERQSTVRIRIDTIVVRDTIRDTLLVPQKIYLTRVDTVYMQLPNDTVKVPVLVPIERKVYRAVVSGFHPNLDSMEIFPQTRVIPRTVEAASATKRRWIRFGIGVGVGYDPFKRSLHPTIQAGVYVPIF